NEIIPEPLPILDLSEKVKVISVSREYETDIITLFHAAGDFKYRSRWQEGVKAVEEINHFLPSVGMRCRCIMEDGQAIIYSTSFSYSPDRIEFSETDEKKKSSTYYTLEKTVDNKTKLTIDIYLKKNVVEQIIFKMIKEKKMKDNFNKSLLNLEELVELVSVISNQRSVV
ncbi:MAG: DUF2652 domain-containing protein, partial [bacterium]